MNYEYQGLSYKNTDQVIKEKQQDGVLVLEYPILGDTGIVNHGISTRIGGVSEGIYSTMNLSFTRGDAEENVQENYERIASVIGVDTQQMVCSRQTHTTNVRVVSRKDCGKGIITERDYTDVDGLLTDLPGICLVTYYADCVPILFVDPVKKVIGSAHSGWRGTVNKMGQVILNRMAEEYGTKAEDVKVAIGPSICQDCYEVSEDVIDCFKAAFDETYWELLFYGKENGKYQLDLWKANELILLHAGVKKENLAVTNLCTCCNPEVLFSHRASNGQRGNLAAFLSLK